MKPYLILYWNELKRNKILVLLFLLAIHWLFILLKNNPSLMFYKLKDHNYLYMLFYTVPMLPLILFYSFTSERRPHKNYLLFSLPVKRSVIILIRYLALISTAVLYPVAFFILPIIVIILRNFPPMSINYLFIIL